MNANDTRIHALGPSRVGERLGNLYLVRLIGAGGMGAVYEAKHVSLPIERAVKILNPEHARSQSTCDRFLREARIAASLKSRHIVAVTDYGRADDGTPYLVMDLLAGEDLASLLRREGPMATSRAANLMAQACIGLKGAHAYESGIVHRDLKPENLFICRDSNGDEILKVLDFGIAKILDSKAHGPKTDTGAAIGTPYYMSPEQAEGGPIDQRTDIYAIGAILYEILCGRKAHPGDSYNRVIANILLGAPVPLRTLRGDLPPGLLAIVQRAMAREPSDRYQSVTELGAALAPFESHGSTLSPRVAIRPAYKHYLVVAAGVLLSTGVLASLQRRAKAPANPASAATINPLSQQIEQTAVPIDRSSATDRSDAAEMRIAPDPMPASKAEPNKKRPRTSASSSTTPRANLSSQEDLTPPRPIPKLDD
jgi:eukaryotic-like serine/threonine-protein kinase